ncbi:cytochrome d ubiquinol oxidase subunit II [Micromonospora sp. M12]
MDLAWYALLASSSPATWCLPATTTASGCCSPGVAAQPGDGGAHRARPVLPRQRGLAGGRRGHPLRRVPAVGGRVARRLLSGRRRCPGWRHPGHRRVQLRSRPSDERIRARWDRVVVIGSALAALGWGVVLAALLQGVPSRPTATSRGGAPGHTIRGRRRSDHGHPGRGARRDLPHPAPADRGGRRGRPHGPSAGAGGAHRGRPGHRRGPALRPGTRLRPAAGGGRTPAGAARGGAAGGPCGAGAAAAGWALVATGAALALPVALVGAALWPYVLVSTTDPNASLTVADAAASAPTLRLLGWVALPLLPALLGFQAMCWWVFRGRTDGRAPVYW